MKMKESAAGCACPLFVAGVRYKSIFEASIETDISSVWIFKTLRLSGGFPVLIKRHMVATEHWVNSRVQALEAKRGNGYER
jgi:hypothetical protein